MVPYLQFTYEKVDRKAADPFKHQPTDPGWDISLVSLEKDEKGNPRKTYTTGLKLRPPDGHYFELVARPNLVRRGYAMQDRVIVTQTTTDVIMVTLYKFDDDAEPLKVPGRWIHAILIPYVWAQPMMGKIVQRRIREEEVEEKPVVVQQVKVTYAGDSDDD